MEKPILLDTDVLVDFFRGFDKAVAFVNEYNDRIILSSIVVAELYAGVKGDAEQAIVCYKQGLAVLERIGDKHNSAKFYNNLGLLYYGQGRSIDARVYLMKAKKLYETVGDDQAVWKTTQEIKRI